MDRLVEKTYLSIVHGRLAPEKGEIDAPIARLPWNRERFGVVPDGRNALTRYQNIVTFKSPDFDEDLSLVSVCPKTGRTHQIRVHMKHIGHPLVGDAFYAGRKVSRNDRDIVARIMLHAWKISFRHPRTGQILALSSKIPDDMIKILPNGISIE